MADRSPSPPTDPGEDFLFHLYRGGELLQDNRIQDAKVELEHALSLQPADPKGQDLLGIVYFRLGLYPRAISIFEKLVTEFGEALEPRVNLALCYLKTGQAARARPELEKVVAEHPAHTRAWGYLGLAHQSLGDIDRALHAFTRGGHDAMAKRLMDATGGTQPASQRRPTGAFTEIDRSADLAPQSSLPQSLSAGWDALLAAADAAQQQTPQTPTPTPAPSPAPRPASPERTTSGNSPSSIDYGIRGALTQAEIGQRHLLVFPREGRVAIHPATGSVLVQAVNGFVVRSALLRALTYAAGITYKTLTRKTRGKLLLDEPLGGETNPLVEVEGRGELVLTPIAEHVLVPITLDDEPMYLREDVLAGFEAQMSYENGRMPTSEGEVVGMVQLRGPGNIVALVRSPFFALELREGKTTALHGPSVLGWMGRVIPRALAANEAPGGLRSLVQFSGEGTVLLHGR